MRSILLAFERELIGKQVVSFSSYWDEGAAEDAAMPSELGGQASRDGGREVVQGDRRAFRFGMRQSRVFRASIFRIPASTQRMDRKGGQGISENSE